MSKKLHRSAMVPFKAQQMFDLVNDIDAYPEYMTGCLNAEVLEKGSDWLSARLELGKGGISQSFTTRNTLTPPQSMTMELMDGPFKIFKGEWVFTDLEQGACKVEFHLEYEFSNFLLGIAGGKLIDQVAGEQVDAVCRRAKQVL